MEIRQTFPLLFWFRLDEIIRRCLVKIVKQRMSLNDWLEQGWLAKHRLDRREIRELPGIATGLSPMLRLQESALTHG
ncbi:MAG: hypothetical protein P3T54_03405 [Dehalogenimonas sp.]|uniref:Uncharacterized protein n=1 Tax=Candidatus Dehalogenimonas loeffleri TaxID=3127115 RepID=A0ABZ2J367_9CHLR|nr:hypothetical protein [Dehalogenimonas sp.]